MLKHCLLLCILVRAIFYFICKVKLIQIITTFLWKKFSFDSLISMLFFFFFFVVIISILLNFSSYFNLVFGIFFSYTLGGCPNGLLYVYTKVFMIDGKWNQSDYSSSQPPIHPITHPSIHLSIIHPSIHPSIKPWIKKVMKIE